MKIVTAVAEMQFLAESLRRDGKIIGFVPTMGFLHDGHLSLMRKARGESDALVASIFVNPTQFGPQEDFNRYPRDAEGDREKCRGAGVDYLFMPQTGQMYPEKPSVFVTVEGISDILEGAVRPGHFRGVATVVSKLFHIVKPHRAYFGQKDFQQCVVLKRMVRELNLDGEIVVLPTVREADGLAMSSRNAYLSPDERRTAVCLARALRAGAEQVQAGVRDPGLVKEKMRAVLLGEPGVAVDYVEAADAETLAPVEAVGRGTVLLVAARVGATRLIDNHLVL